MANKADLKCPFSDDLELVRTQYIGIRQDLELARKVGITKVRPIGVDGDGHASLLKCVQDEPKIFETPNGTGM